MPISRRMLSALFLTLMMAMLIVVVPVSCFFCGPSFPSSWYNIHPGMPFGEVDRRLRAEGMNYGMRREIDGTWDLFYAYDDDIEAVENANWWYGNHIRVQVLVPDPRPAAETQNMPIGTPISSVVLFRFPRHHWMRGWPFYVSETQYRINDVL